jgi:hypothetical protein
MKYEVIESLLNKTAVVVQIPDDPSSAWGREIVASCPTKEAAESAYRLLSLDCLKGFRC